MNIHPFFPSCRRLAAWALSGFASLGAAQAALTPIIEFGSEWRYLDTGTLPPAIGGVTNWKASTYNAAAAGSPWKVGSGIFGYGDTLPYGQIINFGPNANNKYITTYFWQSFQLPASAKLFPAGGATFNSFIIEIMRDDAAAIYVNGQEIYREDATQTRDNLPAPPTAIANTTLANGPVDGDQEGTVVTHTHAGSILNTFPGTNTIAVEVHQSAATTADMRFDLALNLTDAEPCYGDARPGILAPFVEQGRQAGSGTIHERDPLSEPSAPPFTFDDQDTELNWRTVDPAVALVGPTGSDNVSGSDLPNPAFGLSGGAGLTWTSETIDVRNFSNVQVSAKVQAMKRVANYSASDKIEFSVLYSGDGVTFRTLPWQTISTSATSSGTAWTDLIAEGAAKKALVPTSNTVPLSTGANNWRTRGFVDTAWPSGTKGAGYENNPGDSTNYTDLLDSNFNFQSELYGASPRKTVVYMRCTFPAVPNRATFNKMVLRIKYDDGFVAYLNDQEVARKNLTGAPAVTGAGSTASQGNPDTNAVLAEDIDLTSHLAKVDTAQTNVLAIHLLNDKPDSSDMIVWPILQIGKPGGPPAITLANIDDNNVDTYTTIDTTTAGAGGLPLIPNAARAIKVQIKAGVDSFDKALYFDDVTVTGDPISGDSFDTYMAVKAPTASAEDRAARGDLDGDSILNLAEYGFGSDPTVAALQTSVNGVLTPIEPRVSYDAQGRVVVVFRLPGGNITGDPGNGYEVLDLNIRPQITFTDFDGWQDAVLGINRFEQIGPLEENNDGTVTVTCRTIAPQVGNSPFLFVRVRIGLKYPSYLKGIQSICPF